MNIINWILALLSIGICVAEGNDRLINGVPADLKLWPASVYASMGNSRCSATVVGKRTLMIASHCVGNGGTASFSVNAVKYSGTCTQAKEYQNNSTADWALCVLTKDVEGIPFEHLNIDDGKVRVDDEILLTGYGCIKPGGGGGNDGIYRIGKAKVTKVPKGSNHDIVTRGGAALCFGDSGGPAFAVDEKTGERWLVGINSRGDISKTSYLSSVATSVAQNFISEWATKNQQRICGVHSDAQGCRDLAELDLDSE